MTIGELKDLIEEKLKTGEWNALDNVYVRNNSDEYQIVDVDKDCATDVLLIIHADLGIDQW